MKSELPQADTTLKPRSTTTIEEYVLQNITYTMMHHGMGTTIPLTHDVALEFKVVTGPAGQGTYETIYLKGQRSNIEEQSWPRAFSRHVNEAGVTSVSGIDGSPDPSKWNPDMVTALRSLPGHVTAVIDDVLQRQNYSLHE